MAHRRSVGLLQRRGTAEPGTGRSSPRTRNAALVAVTVLAVLAASCSTSTPSADHRTHSTPRRTTTSRPSVPTSTSSTSSSSSAGAGTTTTTEALAFTSTGSAAAVAGSTFHFEVTTTCASAPAITAGGLPAGFKVVDQANCSATMSGMASRRESGTHVVVITAASALATVTQHFVLTIEAVPILRTKSTLSATVGVALNVVVATSRGLPVPGISTASALPPGLTLANVGAGTAALVGTPVGGTGGTYPISVVANNGVGPPVTATLSVTVLQAPGITAVPAVTVTAGVPMAPLTISVVGAPVPSLRASGLPKGLTLVASGSGAVLSGTPATTGAGVHTVALRAQNRVGIATGTLSVTVQPAT